MSGLKHRGYFLAATLMMLGCSADDLGPGYETILFDAPSTPPEEVVLGSKLIKVPVGYAVRVTPVAMGDNGEPLQGEVSHVTVRSSDLNILRTYPGPQEGQVVLVGAGIGQTTLLVSLQSKDVDNVPVDVVPQ